MKLRPLAVIVASIALTACVTNTSSPPGTSTGSVAVDDATRTFASLNPRDQRAYRGVLRIPEGAAGPVPAVVIVHGTNGIDARGAFYRDALHAAGIATYEVDFKTGVFRDASDRPPNDEFLPLAYAALRDLRGVEAIAPDRIGILGFSLGGHLAVTTASEQNRQVWLQQTQGFAAHAGLYPGCRYLAQKFNYMFPTEEPTLIVYGTRDSYGDGTACPALRESLGGRYPGVFEFVEYPGAYHAFDLPGRERSGYDPAADGKKVTIRHDAASARDARSRVTDFFRNALAGGAGA